MVKDEILRQLTHRGLTLVRAIGLTRAIHRISQRVPQRAQLWLLDRRATARLRAGDTETLLRECGHSVPEREFKRMCHDAWALLADRADDSDLGDYLEFGVYVGTSMACMHEVLEERGLDDIRMFGFDSFMGLPPADTHADDTFGIAPWRAYGMRVPEKLAREHLSQRGVKWSRTTLVKGFFEATLKPEVAREHRIRKAGVIMVDSNLYSSAKTALEFCAPLIQDHAVIALDDWCPDTLGAARTGERRAFEEFLAAHPDLTAEELESYLPENAKVFLVSRTEHRADRGAPRSRALPAE